MHAVDLHPGTYIDPARSSYGAQPSNTPFPVSKIRTPIGTPHGQPSVAYQASAKAFFVVWRELPAPDPKNDESRSHIRGHVMASDVPDGLANTAQVPKPGKNVVVSPVTGGSSCQPKMLCLSAEDPQFPDVTAIGGKAVAVLWQETLSNGWQVLRRKVLRLP